MAQLSTRVAAGWRAVAAAALVVTMSAPLWFASDAAAQAALPETAVAAPDSTVLYHEIDLDREGAQWQQVEELLGRVGLPDALDMWEEELLAEGARKGDFTQADLDALFGGEMAITVSPDAVKLLATMHQGEHGMGEAMATPMADENAPMGVAAILLAGDPDASLPDFMNNSPIIKR